MDAQMARADAAADTGGDIVCLLGLVHRASMPYRKPCPENNFPVLPRQMAYGTMEGRHGYLPQLLHVFAGGY